MAKKIDYAAMFTLRKDGRYQGYWRELDADGQPTGKRHTICDRDAHILYDKIREKENPAPLTFRRIAEAWHDAVWDDFKRGTQVCYTPAYKRAVDRFGDRIAAEIEPHEIKAHLEWLKSQKYSKKTIDTQRIVYRQIFRHAIIDPAMGKELRINPVAEVQLPTNLPPQKKREAPEDEIVRQVRSSTAYFSLFPLLLMSTGFRRGEALGLRWCDIDLKKKEIHISEQISYAGGIEERTEPKTDAGVRSVPILHDLYDALCQAKPEDAKPTDYIFHGDDPSRWLHQSTFQRRWTHYCREMGFVEDVPELRTSKQGRKYIKHNYKNTLTPHVFRHGYATLLFEAEIDVYTAQQLLGHADVETTMAIYTHLRQKKKDESIDKLRQYVKAQVSADAAPAP